MKLFEAFGIMAISDLPGVDGVMKLSRDQREAALLAMSRVREKRLRPALLIVSKSQVMAVPELAFDLLDNCMVVDVRGYSFLDRKKNKGG